MDVLTEFINYCETNTFEEVCGLIVNKRGIPKFIPCKNISIDKQNSFILDPIDYANATKQGDILYIVHSHINSSEEPSEYDKASCDSGSIPWIIYSIISKKYYVLNPSNYEAPIIGRKYFYGIYDCWTLIRDIYKQDLNIELIYPRDPDPEWWLHGGRYFNELIEPAGFIEINDGSIKKYDVFLMQTNNSPVLNHSGLYYGDNLMLHHAYNRLSCREIYGGYWSKITQKVIRYKDLL